ncbi:hypothetical protein VNO77_13157 [Canavalia gladiata]|uniref:Ripening-related protein grip22 n=1 Tax=Canavalia gladiata TaxID=3824 RepID=A0AAN9QN78_CANGL
MANTRVLMIFCGLILNVMVILLSYFPNAAFSKSHHNHHSRSHHFHSPEINPSGTHGILTVNNFAHGGDGGGPSECDGKFHPLPARVVALSTGWYAEGARCGKLIRIKAKNGRSTVANVVDECDSKRGCKSNIVDASKSVWNDLRLDIDKGEVPVTWTMV